MTQRVIDGKLYDTESADRIASYCPNADRGDFWFLNEVLYRTENGRYFLYGEGGPQTKYARSVSGGTSGGDEITPKTPEQAIAWCEQREIDGGIVAEEFAEHIEDA